MEKENLDARLTIRMTDYDKQQLLEFAIEHGMTTGQVVRKALEKFYERYCDGDDSIFS